MTMRVWIPTMLALVAIFAFSGCGDKEANAGSSAANQPVVGEAPSESSQLVGTWFRENQGEFVGMEFLDNGKAMLTGGRRAGQILTTDYDLLDGGRLSLVAAGGRTTIYNVKLDGGRMELVSGTGNNQPQRYRRLAKGVTIATALKEEAELKRQQAEKLAEFATNLIQQKQLVVSPKDASQLTVPRIALEIDSVQSGQIKGFAYYKIPARKHQLTGSIVPDAGKGQARITLNFGKQVQPANANSANAGNMAFQVTGDPSQPEINASVRFGQGNAQDMQVNPERPFMRKS